MAMSCTLKNLSDTGNVGAGVSGLLLWTLRVLLPHSCCSSPSLSAFAQLLPAGHTICRLISAPSHHQPQHPPPMLLRVDHEIAGGFSHNINVNVWTEWAHLQALPLEGGFHVCRAALLLQPSSLLHQGLGLVCALADLLQQCHALIQLPPLHGLHLTQHPILGPSQHNAAGLEAADSQDSEGF